MHSTAMVGSADPSLVSRDMSAEGIAIVMYVFGMCYASGGKGEHCGQ
jgi:hypothetical protein